MKTGHATRGRPRSFDREQALRRAMNLFHAHGYDGVTLEELLRAMGDISPPSFYAAFGSKDALFREAVSLYRTTVGDRVVQALAAPAVRDAIEGMMRAAVAMYTSDAAPGCLVVLGALNATRTSKNAHDHLCALRAQGAELIRRRLARAVEEGELPSGLPLADIAAFFVTIQYGMSVRARDGATRAALLSTVDAAMAAWPALTAGSRSAAPRKAPRSRRR